MLWMPAHDRQAPARGGGVGSPTPDCSRPRSRACSTPSAGRAQTSPARPSGCRGCPAAPAADQSWETELRRFAPPTKLVKFGAGWVFRFALAKEEPQRVNAERSGSSRLMNCISAENSVQSFSLSPQILKPMIKIFQSSYFLLVLNQKKPGWLVKKIKIKNKKPLKFPNALQTQRVTGRGSEN